MHILLLIVILACGLCAAIARTAFAKLDFIEPQNRADCDSILLATFAGRQRPDPHQKVAEHDLNARYRVYRVLKGPPLGISSINIKFDVHDLAAPSDPHKNDKAMMPQMGSKWILFIPFLIPKNGAYETLLNGKGKVECTEQNLRVVLTELGDEFDPRFLDPDDVTNFEYKSHTD